MSHIPAVKRNRIILGLSILTPLWLIVTTVDIVLFAPDWYGRGNIISGLVMLLAFMGLTTWVYMTREREAIENVYIEEGTERNELIAKLHKDIDNLTEALKDESPVDREYIPAALRKYVTERDRCTCFYCGNIGTRRHDHRKRTWNIDHLLPISRGGSNAPSNLVLACESCNLSKNNKTAAEFFHYKYWRYISQERQAATKI